MPDMRMRRILLALVLLGLVLGCTGTLLYITAPTFRDLDGRLFFVRGSLIAAWLILVPIFVFLIRLRSRARRGTRRKLVQQQDDLDQQVTDMLTPEGIRAIGGETSTVKFEHDTETTTLEGKPQ